MLFASQTRWAAGGSKALEVENLPVSQVEPNLLMFQFRRPLYSPWHIGQSAYEEYDLSSITYASSSLTPNALILVVFSLSYQKILAFD